MWILLIPVHRQDQKLPYLGNIQTQLILMHLQVPEIKESDIRNSIALPQVPNVDDRFSKF